MNDELKIILTISNIIVLAVNIALFTVKANQGVTPILRLYNDTIVQCKDDACRQYVNVFYVRVLRELTSEPQEVKGESK